MGFLGGVMSSESGKKITPEASVELKKKQDNCSLTKNPRLQAWSQSVLEE